MEPGGPQAGLEPRGQMWLESHIWAGLDRSPWALMIWRKNNRTHQLEF